MKRYVVVQAVEVFGADMPQLHRSAVSSSRRIHPAALSCRRRTRPRLVLVIVTGCVGVDKHCCSYRSPAAVEEAIGDWRGCSRVLLVSAGGSLHRRCWKAWEGAEIGLVVKGDSGVVPCAGAAAAIALMSVVLT